MLFEDAFKLDNYLSREFIEEACQGKIVNEYPDLDNLLQECKELLSNFEYAPVPPANGQVYDGKVTFINNDYYYIHWDVEDALAIIKDKKLELEDLSVEYLIDAVDMTEMNNKYLRKSLLNKDPIIVAYYPLLGKEPPMFVLDGNHRLTFSYRKRKKVIRGYLLEPQHHFNALRSSLDRLLYLVHQNIITLVDYMTGKADKEKLGGTLGLMRKQKQKEEELLQNFFNK
jgi:hypothetical protein